MYFVKKQRNVEKRWKKFRTSILRSSMLLMCGNGHWNWGEISTINQCRRRFFI